MSLPIAIRLSAEHLRDVAEIETLCFEEPWSENALRLLLGEQGEGAVCLCNGRAVAYGGMILAPDEAQITNIATHPAHRRRGYANAVVRALIESARQRGLLQIVLEVRASNQGAVALYGALGFEACGVRKKFYRKPTEDALVMIKRLERG